MASLQHVYRRGHIFWWRRVHFSFHSRPIDVRLSLGTPDRRQARNRGAALTASYDRVVAMMQGRLRQDRDLTEGQIQQIVRTMYEERLTELCHEQRASPGDAELHSAANLAFVDYFERQTRHGGNLSFSPGEEARLLSAGWEEGRIADLKMVIRQREERGIDPVRSDDIDRHLSQAGFSVSDQLRHMVQLALYPALRDAFADAQQQLTNGGGVSRVEDDPVEARPQTAASQEIPQEWRSLTPCQVADRMIAETPKLLEHRRGGKRGKASVDEHTLRQIRWAAVLLEKQLPVGTPFWKVTKSDIIALDKSFDTLPIHFGKSIHDRDPGHTLAVAAANATDRVADGKLEQEQIGLSTATTNKHFNKLGQLHKFMRMAVPAVIPIDFTEFTAPVASDESEQRMRYSRDQGEAIFRLPPWTGCRGEDHRLESGKRILHDGLFFVLLLVWYTGARREEICKLMLDDVETRHGIDYLLIRSSATGRVKNKSARRVVVLADELIRLGFLRYVQSMREEGETLLFPELTPGGDTTRKFGDVFYKLWWIYIKPLVPNLLRGQAMHAARHMVADEMKDQEVFVEFRNDHLGHRGKGGEGETRYPSRASLTRLREIVAKIPIVTSHLPEQSNITLLPVRMRRPRPVRLERSMSA